MTKQEANIQILGLIAEAVTKYPNENFFKVLSNIKVIELWYGLPEKIDIDEESEVTLKRIIK